MEKKLKTPSSMLDALQKQFHDLLFFNTGIPQHKRGAVQALNLQGLMVRFG
jgi:hypothetical protein